MNNLGTFKNNIIYKQKTCFVCSLPLFVFLDYEFNKIVFVLFMPRCRCACVNYVCVCAYCSPSANVVSHNPCGFLPRASVCGCKQWSYWSHALLLWYYPSLRTHIQRDDRASPPPADSFVVPFEYVLSEVKFKQQLYLQYMLLKCVCKQG